VRRAYIIPPSDMYKSHPISTEKPCTLLSPLFLLKISLLHHLHTHTPPHPFLHSLTQNKKMEVTWPTLVSTLWEPWYLMLVTLTFIPQTLLQILRHGHLHALASWHAFQDAWFANVWAVLGSQFAAGSEPVVKDLLSRARGVVLDIGPGAGNWVHLYPNPNPNPRTQGAKGAPGVPVTKIFGVEPNLEQHGSLRRKVKEAGLDGVYEVVGAGSADLGRLGLGIGKGTVDTVVTKQVLCSVPGPERLVRELYGYLKPGGVWIMYEHVKTKEGGWVEWYQGMFALIDFLCCSV
jgi:SAM-dependent methyltransferase